MQIGIVGAGEVGAAVARFLGAQGHRILLANRSGGEPLERLAESLPGDVVPADVPEALAAELVVLAVPWNGVAETLAAAPAWEGRVLVDATNPFTRHRPPLELADLDGMSASVLVSQHAPGARVVKAFNLPMVNFTRGALEGDARRVLFVSGDDPAATSLVEGLIRAGGYTTIDLGGLEEGGRMQQAGGPLAGWDLLVAHPRDDS